MKYRQDFVTNSSSSSFLIAFHSKDEGILELSKLATRIPVHVGRLLRDFIEAEPVAIEEILEHWKHDLEGQASVSLDYNSDWGDSEFRKEWIARHPDAQSYEYYCSSERQERIGGIIDNEIKQIGTDLGDRTYIVDIECEDHDDIGSDLEHNIVPHLDCTVRRFSRH